MERQFCTLIAFLLFISFHAFGQRGVTRIYTDYGGFWTSGVNAINNTKPDNKHNLLAFTWNNITYSTGVNDPLLRSKGIIFQEGLYQAFPVANINLNGLNQNYVALGSRENDNLASDNYPYTVPVKISDILTRGINGLDLGSGITNIPASAEPLLFNFGAIIDAGQINDGIPDLLISQIASPGTNNLDRVWFEDANHNRVGNEVTIDMSNNQLVPSVGNWTLDLFSPVTGVNASARTDRQIRIWAADVSLFGLNAANYTQPLYVRFKLGGSSDPAFLAFNRKFIEIITADDDDAFTEINTPVNIDVLQNDGPTTVLSPASLRILRNPQHGSATVVIDNGVYKVRYTPAQGYEGTDNFSYQVANNAATPSTDDATVNMTIGSADVSVNKTFSPAATYFNDEILFNVAVQNNGTGRATGVMLTDVLPSGYTYISSTTNSTTPYNLLTGTWNVGTISAGQRFVLQLRARVNLSGNYTNTASVTASSIDNNLTNNTSAVSPVPGYMSDLSISKTVDVTNPLVGSTVVFQIQANNTGPTAATGVYVTDLLPSGYTYVSSSATQGSYDAATGKWLIENMGILGLQGYTAPALTIRASLNPTGNYLNAAVITGNEPDAVPANNTASVSTTPIPVADLSLEKSIDNAALNNNSGNFIITVRNNGPSLATNVKVIDPLPSGYRYVSSGSGTGTYNAQTGEWDIGSLIAGATATLNISTMLNPGGLYLNTASVGSDARDPVNGNNTDSAGPEPLAPTGTTQQLFCEADRPTLSSLTVNGSALRWYLTATGGTAIASSTLLTNGTSYFVSQSIAGAESIGRLQVQVLLSPPPVAPVLPNAIPVTYCRTDAAIPLQAQVLAGNRLLWYRSAAGGTAELLAPTPQTLVAGSTTYYVSQQNGLGCEGPRTAIPVIVSELPAAPISGGDQVACESPGLILTASANTPPGYSIIWYNSNNQVVQEPILSAPGTVTYWAEARNNATGCIGPVRTAVTLTINAAAPLPVSGGDQAACPSTPLQTLRAEASTTAGNRIIWYDAPVAGNPVAEPLLNQIGSITYYAASSNLQSGCESLGRVPVQLTIYPAVTAVARTEQPTCNNRTGNIIIDAQTGISFTLRTADGSMAPVTNNNGSFRDLLPGIYSVVVSNAGGCSVTIADITIEAPFCPQISLTKAADNLPSRTGEIINYTLIIRNLGNVALTDLRVVDQGADQGSITPVAVNLLPGESATIKASHTLTQAEVNQGFFSNQASVSGSAPGNYPVADLLSDDPATTVPDDPTVLQIPSAAAITLVKTGTLSADYEYISYNFSIMNTGNVTLYRIRLQDDKLGLNQELQTELAPGQEINHTATYQISVADKINRSTLNTARVTGAAPNGTAVTDLSGTTQNNDQPTVIAIPSEAAIALVKTAVLNGNSITYTFTITNTGKLSLSGLTLADPKLGWTSKALPGTLYPGASLTYQEVYTLSQADREAGTVLNTATVRAETQGEVVVTDRSGSLVSNDDPTAVTVAPAPIAVNDRAETKANAAVLIDILKNDNPIQSRFDPSTVLIVATPKFGTVFINSDGTVTYTPLPGFTGEDSFSYRVSDVEGYQTNIALVNITANFFSIAVANTFTPNGDGVNDFFNIVGLNQYAENELTIFNRWGSELYRKQNYENNWSGEGLNEGTYFYLLRLKRKDSLQWEIYKGWVLLKRAYIK